jgi:hypothetical protein
MILTLDHHGPVTVLPVLESGPGPGPSRGIQVRPGIVITTSRARRSDSVNFKLPRFPHASLGSQSTPPPPPPPPGGNRSRRHRRHWADLKRTGRPPDRRTARSGGNLEGW